MLAAAAIAWGGMFAVVKPLMAEMDPFTLTLLRYGLTAPIFLVLLVAIEGRRALATEGRMLRLWWLGTLGFAGFGLFAFLGLGTTRPEHASVIPAMMPLITVGVVAMRGRAWPAPRALAAVALGLAGVVLVVTHGEPGTLLTGGAGRGEALVLLGATCWVVYTLGAANFPGWSGLRYTALTCAFGTLSIAVAELVALAAGVATLPAPATLIEAAPAFGYLVLAASVVAVLGWNAGMRALGPARGVLFINLVPVTAFTIAVLGGRVPAGAEIAGVALVIAALVLNSLAPAARAPAALSLRTRG
jgi:drug/metabolite transporter (DMT)-like permease